MTLRCVFIAVRMERLHLSASWSCVWRRLTSGWLPAGSNWTQTNLRSSGSALIVQWCNMPVEHYRLALALSALLTVCVFSVFWFLLICYLTGTLPRLLGSVASTAFCQWVCRRLRLCSDTDSCFCLESCWLLQSTHHYHRHYHHHHHHHHPQMSSRIATQVLNKGRTVTDKLQIVMNAAGAPCYHEHRQVRARSVIHPASGTSLAERAWTDPVYSRDYSLSLSS